MNTKAVVWLLSQLSLIPFLSIRARPVEACGGLWRKKGQGTAKKRKGSCRCAFFLPRGQSMPRGRPPKHPSYCPEIDIAGVSRLISSSSGHLLPNSWEVPATWIVPPLIKYSWAHSRMTQTHLCTAPLYFLFLLSCFSVSSLRFIILQQLCRIAFEIN